MLVHIFIYTHLDIHIFIHIYIYTHVHTIKYNCHLRRRMDPERNIETCHGLVLA